MEKNWHEEIKLCLGKNCKLQAVDINNFVANVQAVFLGIKPSYLLDKFCCTPQKFSEMIRIIFTNCPLVSRIDSYAIILFENGDLFLVNIELCIDNIKEALEKLKLCTIEDCCDSIPNALTTIIIDITEALDEPQEYFSASKKAQHKIENVYLNVLTTLLQFHQSQKEADSGLHFIRICRFNLTCNLNLCTVYGILLNYPFVYWFDEDISLETSINMTKLYVTKLQIPLTRHQIKKTIHSKTHFEIYSFTYPSNLHSCLNKMLQNWKSKIVAMVESIFKNNYSIKEFCVTVPYLSC